MIRTAPMAINIIRLEPMRVASAYGFGDQPEAIAWDKLSAWAKPKGFLDDIGCHPIFGFNNPYPTEEHPRYGYEFWMKVGAETEPEDEIRIGEFFGGTYAVARCEVNGHPENILAAWQLLATWCKQNNHTMGHNALERFLTTPDDLERLVLELHCPIVS